MTDLDRFLAARDFLISHRDDLSGASQGFEWPSLGQFNWGIDYFDHIAKDNAAPALRILEEDGQEARLSYAELSQRSSQVASFLTGLGAKPGDRILVMLGNEVPLWETMLASIKMGLVVIPATTLLSGPDLRDRVQRGNVRWLLTNPSGMEKVLEIPAQDLGEVDCILAGDQSARPPQWVNYHDSLQADANFTPAASLAVTEPQLEYFTSGTTAAPKLVRHSRQSYPVGHLTTMYWLGLKPNDVHWTISSPGWAKHAWSCFFAPFNAQACVFIYNYSRFNAPQVLDVLVKNQVTTLCAPPTVWRFLIQEELAQWPVQLREVISAGEPLNPEVIEQVRASWGLTIRDGYGQTETTAMIANAPGQPLKPGSMGKPLPGYPIVLVDPDGQPADEGEICIDLSQRPLSLMDGYADDVEKTATVMRDGYYHTGDVGAMDAEGYITYVGRADDVFKASGYRISPFELESALIEHDAVAEAAVVPSPDALRGFVPKAFVILAPGHEPNAATAQSILAYMKERVSPYKMVRRLEFSDLPKTISGKIRRVDLRKQEATRANTGEAPAGEFSDELLKA
ncbi:MAG: Acetyl-coenzyme synthetase [Pseudomonadota bacterium]